MSWESPINVIYGEMQTKVEGDVYKVVQSYGIDVDKDELIAALKYDRAQYDNGYADGRAARDAEIIRCKDCKWIDLCKDPEHYEYKGANGFCSKGEREDEVEE